MALGEIDIDINGNTLKIKYIAINDIVSVFWKPADSDSFTGLFKQGTDVLWQQAADDKSGLESGRAKMTLPEWWDMFRAKVTTHVLEILSDSPIIYDSQDWENELRAKIDAALWDGELI
ncbi:hypothetical protein KAR91_46370 [Candidatus Pacearchaeota archaeon]|nr:hypothetical protein [Candidatus Pacearchaeota archaeon]